MATAVSSSPFLARWRMRSLLPYCVVTTTGLMFSYLSFTTRNTCPSVQSVGDSLPRSSSTRHPTRESLDSTPSSVPSPP